MFSVILSISIITSSVCGFYKPDCEYAGMSCFDCYTLKQCINFFGLVRWSTTSCGTSLTGTANVYCDPNTDKCTSIKPDGCDPMSRYTCLRDGLLPDLNDCTVYHLCIGMAAEDFACENKYVYNQKYGKCVLKLSNDDCFTLPSCSLQDYTELYPGDSSIYYGCAVSKSFIKACTETEMYNLNTNTCESRCTSTQNIPNSRNCLTYYQCGASEENVIEAKEVLCPAGQGYNPSTNKCDSNYQNLCNELYLLESDIYNLITFTPAVEMILQPIKAILSYFNISPVSVIFMFGLEDQTLSDGILIIDYIYKNKKLPSTIIGIIVDTILPYLPASVQTIFKTLMNFGIINIRSTTTPIDNHQSDDLRNYLISVLSNATIDIPEMINSCQGKNQEEISKMVFDKTMEMFKIPESQVSFIVMMFKTKMPLVVNLLNQKCKTDLFMSQGNILKLNQSAVDALVHERLDVVAHEMYPHSTFLAEIFKMIAKQRYAFNHSLVSNVLDNFYFTTSGLI